MNLASLALPVLLFLEPSQPAKPKVSFNHQIRPLLSDRCYTCHGPDERTRKGGLRLDLREAALEAGAFVPGKPEESELVVRLHATDKKLMPPAKTNLTLTPEEKKVLAQWIAEGAVYEPHWAFMAPVPHKPPTVPSLAWTKGPIDAFILERLEREGLKPSPSATMEMWLRRVSFDLTGLPPTPAEIEAFLKDSSPQAKEKQVDRLLASKGFGERMALPWLDMARYADSYGYQADADTDFWPWRDWVIRSFNDNLPYDQFLTWQLAGDLLPQPTRDQRLATAFNRLHRMTNEGGSIPEEWRLEYVADRVHTFGTAMLGMTLECCRCHDHKYDPITMKDYYSLSAFFNNIDEWGTYDSARYKPTPTLNLATPEQEKRVKEAREKLRSLEATKEEIRKKALLEFPGWLQKQKSAPTSIAGELGRYSFDKEEKEGTIANLSNPAKPASRSTANQLVAGKKGKAIQFTGDDPATFPVDWNLERDRPFTVSLELSWPKDLAHGLIFHRSAGTDTGFHGPEARIDDGKLVLGLVRFWPGNAAMIRTIETFPKDEWTQVAFVHDGTGKAAGLEIWVNGQKQKVEILKDNLSKNVEPSGGGIVVGERMRTPGLRNAKMDELRIFSRALSPIEIKDLSDGKSLAQAFENQDPTALPDYFLAQPGGTWDTFQKELHKVRHELFQAETTIPEIPTMVEMAKPRQTYLLARGVYDAPRDKPVERATPVSLGGWKEEYPKNRLGLARWLTAPGNPLAARVAVNQFWQHFFGKGLVPTSENLGLQGNLPTHPELLDWLALEFSTTGWDVKKLCKAMVLSSTYGQASSPTAELITKDPDNLFYGRMSPRKLTAELLRDTALFSGGLLVDKTGGPPVKPYQPAGLWRGQNAFLPEYVADKGEGLHRKSMYTFWRRTSPPPNMLAFDAPTRETCVARRQATSTPLQPLVLLNDPQWVEAARNLGLRMLKTQGKTQDKIQAGFQIVTSRLPTEMELDRLTQLWTKQEKSFGEDKKAASAFLSLGEPKAPKDVNLVEFATAYSVAATILNLDAATTLR